METKGNEDFEKEMQVTDGCFPNDQEDSSGFQQVQVGHWPWEEQFQQNGGGGSQILIGVRAKRNNRNSRHLS